ncbi:MAG: bifunctional folylpolyglutamate synthase/dihydrofolate synthase [Clostridia bacterium]|nr:bifunctional folylpolyglutamate synthase/dihydrofolate synthase [Clostridia bacterium]
MTYSEALAYIHSVTWKGSRPGLERITELCERLGNPQDSLRFIHVAGTNGKGSTCRMLASILEKAGYRVGLFTSPYIERFNERIMLCGQDIADDDLARDTETVRVHADAMADSPTEFELITAIALVYYKRMQCDFVVFECGLGGRLDSTNVIKTPVLSLITGIDLDHTAILGDTAGKIAAEKAGIIKQGVPVLFGEGTAEAEEVIRQTAEEKNSPYYRTDFSKIADINSDLSGTAFRFDGRTVKIGLHGLYQTRNTATVLTAVRILRECGIAVSEAAVDEGLASAYWPARFEIIADTPTVIYDGAHNPQGIAGAVENIAHYLSPMTEDGKVALLMGVMADKDHEKMIAMLAPYARAVFSVTPANERSLHSADLGKEFEACGVRAEAYEDLPQGVRAAVDFAKKEKCPLVCLGSLYMYADVKHAVRENLNN